MPGQQRGQGDDPMGPQPAGEQLGQDGQDRSVCPGEAGPGHLTVQHRDSVTQDEDLDILAAVLRASSLSQPSSLMLIKYNSRNNTADDHAMIAVGSLTAGH
jgi:hypothetical protein